MTEDNAADKYLVYQLGADFFATPLIEVRGVIEHHAAKPIPHTAPFFKGVINVRGEIIGVIDLRERLGLRGVDQPACQLVFETEIGALAATVDRVLSVAVLPPPDINRRTAGDAHAAETRPYFLGVAKYGEEILTLVSLRQLASDQELTRLTAF